MITSGLLQHVALSCAIGSFLLSLGAAVSASSGREKKGSAHGGAHLARLLALQLGVVTAIVQAIVLAMRIIYVGIDLWHGYSWAAIKNYGCNAQGLWSLTFLWLSIGVGLLTTRNGKLLTGLIWCSAAYSTWACLLLPPFRVTSIGGIERSGTTVFAMTSLAAILTAGVLLALRLRREHERTNDERSQEHLGDWAPGFRATCVVLAAIVTTLVCYHLLIPVRLGVWGTRGATLMTVGSAALASQACFLLLSGSWGHDLADCAMTLTSLAISAGTVLLVTLGGGPLGDRYPVLFNALLVGFGMACAVWGRMAIRWTADVDASHPSDRSQLSFHARRAALLCAAMALMCATMMSFWPRLPGIAGMDHTRARVVSGLGGNLFLLLVLLWCARHLRRWSFHILSLLALGSSFCFLLIRALPFRSHFG